MSAVESDRKPERGPPDLSFLGRPSAVSPDIPNLAPSGGESGNHRRLRHGDGKILTVGGGITVTGEINACDTLVVEGTVEATLSAGRKLDISPTGTFTGRAEVEHAVVAGLFDGELIVHDRLHVAAGGSVRGTVRYGKLEIEAGGELHGDVAVTAADS